MENLTAKHRRTSVCMPDRSASKSAPLNSHLVLYFLMYLSNISTASGVHAHFFAFFAKESGRLAAFLSLLTCCADQVQLHLSDRRFRRDFRLLIRHPPPPSLVVLNELSFIPKTLFPAINFICTGTYFILFVDYSPVKTTLC